MRIALLSDIHANREAFDACLADMARLGPDRYVILGDLVGYGPDPGYVVDRVRDLQRDGAMVLRGNHDAAIGKSTAGMVEHAARALDWTREALDAEARAYLEGLPLTHTEGAVLFVHASAERPETWRYVLDRDDAQECLAATEARLVFCGHTHVPALFHVLSARLTGARPRRPPDYFRPLAGKPIPYSKARRYVTVLGSVGQPRDRDPAACWGLYDTDADSFTLHRTPYDAEATLRKIKDAGLPEWLGRRLLEGR